jgi:prolyl oligopeptidase PreP (S9A serine peptidase family)
VKFSASSRNSRWFWRKEKNIILRLLIIQRQEQFFFDPNVQASQLYMRSQVDFKSDDYESKQVFYTSKDGTKFLIITYKKDYN